MEVFPKINTLFKRHKDGPKKGKLIVGDWAVPELEYLQHNDWEFTEKVDGTNIRIGFCQNGETPVRFKGRSDNASIPEPLLRHLEQKFDYALLEGAGLGSAILFGEGYGPKIQNGGNYRDDVSFVLFDVKIDDWWLKREDVNDIADKLGIESVPVIGHGTLQDAIDIVSTGITFNANGGIKRWGAGGLRSQWGDFEAEGIVARPVVQLFDRGGNRVITKIKGRDFKDS